MLAGGHARGDGAVTAAIEERIQYALLRPQAADSGHRVAELARLLDEPAESVYEALNALRERGLVTLHGWPAGGRRGSWFAALEPPPGYGVRTTLGRGSLGRGAARGRPS